MGTFLGMNGTCTYPIPSHNEIASTHYAVFRILIVVGEDADDIVHRQLPPIPYGMYPDLRGVRQVVVTNVGVCIPLYSIKIPAYVFRVCDIMSPHPPPLLKGVVNVFFALKRILFSVDSHNVVVTDLLSTHHHTFSHQWSPSILPHSYNYRLYYQLYSLSRLVNSKLNCLRQYDRPIFVERMSLGLETWEHLVGRLEGGNVLVRRNLKRVRCNWYPDLSTEKVRIGGQTSWEITVRTVGELAELREVTGISFGVGVKRRLRFGDGRVHVRLGDTLFALDTGDDGDGDLFVMRYDVGSAILSVIMQFTRVVVSNISDPVAGRIISNIKHSMMQLFASQQVDLDAKFAYNNSIHVTSSFSNGIVTCILDEGDGDNVIHLSKHECIALITAYNSNN